MRGFKASNGWYTDDEDYLIDDTGDIVLAIDDNAVESARQFFQEERDAELGRWRDKEQPDYVVYSHANRDSVRVLNENTGFTGNFHRECVEPLISSIAKVAARYFKTHPQRKPWHAAKPGEVWVMRRQSDGYARAYIATDYGTFDAPSEEYTMSDIEFVEGHCIYRIENEATND